MHEGSTVIGTELVTEFVQTVLLTGRLADESPLSTFIIAKPEHGKTSICLESPFSNAVDLTDTTGKGLQEILKYKSEISHIILNDLTAVMAHGKTVRAYLIAMINAMTEEGIRSIAFPGQVEIFQNGKRGIIGCVTPGLVNDTRTWFNKIGLTSRIVPFHYKYSSALIIRIKAAIDKEQHGSAPPVLHIPQVPVRVHINENESAQIRALSDKKQVELGDDTGIRRLKQFRRLAKAHALIKGNWKNAIVGESDINFLISLQPYIDYKNGCALPERKNNGQNNSTASRSKEISSNTSSRDTMGTR